MSAIQWLCRRAAAMSLLSSPRIALGTYLPGSHLLPQLSKSVPFIFPIFIFAQSPRCGCLESGLPTGAKWPHSACAPGSSTE